MTSENVNQKPHPALHEEQHQAGLLKKFVCLLEKLQLPICRVRPAAGCLSNKPTARKTDQPEPDTVMCRTHRGTHSTSLWTLCGRCSCGPMGRSAQALWLLTEVFPCHCRCRLYRYKFCAESLYTCLQAENSGVWLQTLFCTFVHSVRDKNTHACAGLQACQWMCKLTKQSLLADAEMFSWRVCTIVSILFWFTDSAVE